MGFKVPSSTTPLLRRTLLTKAGKRIYARGKAIVEPVFGQIKQARGIRYFPLRGLKKRGANGR